MVNEYSLRAKHMKTLSDQEQQRNIQEEKHMAKHAHVALTRFILTLFLCFCLIGCYGDELSTVRIKSSA